MIVFQGYRVYVDTITFVENPGGSCHRECLDLPLYILEKGGKKKTQLREVEVYCPK